MGDSTPQGLLESRGPELGTAREYRVPPHPIRASEPRTPLPLPTPPFMLEVRSNMLTLSGGFCFCLVGWGVCVFFLGRGGGCKR